MDASVDTSLAGFLREFGLSVVVVLFLGWVFYTLVQSFVPKIAEALAKRIEAGTKLVEVTTSTVEKLPDVIAQNGKETRDVIIGWEKAVIASEARILDAFKSTLIAIKDEIFDSKQEKIEKGLNRLSKHSINKDPDTDPAVDVSKHR